MQGITKHSYKIDHGQITEFESLPSVKQGSRDTQQYITLYSIKIFQILCNFPHIGGHFLSRLLPREIMNDINISDNPDVMNVI